MEFYRSTEEGCEVGQEDTDKQIGEQYNLREC